MPSLPFHASFPSHRIFGAAAATGLLVTLTGCPSNTIVTDTKPVTATETAPPALAVDVPILGKVSGQKLSGEQYGLQLLNPADLQGTGLAQAFADIGITLDPAKHSVVLLALGEQQGPASADITALQIKGKTLYVQGKASAPPADADLNQATSPFVAVAIRSVPNGTVVRSDIN